MEIQRLTTEYNPNPGQYVEAANLSTEFSQTEYALLSQAFDLEAANIAGFDDGSNFPKTCKEACTCPDWPEWKKAIFTEFGNMEEKRVWKLVRRAKVPIGRRLIGNRWVFI